MQTFGSELHCSSNLYYTVYFISSIPLSCFILCYVTYKKPPMLHVHTLSLILPFGDVVAIMYCPCCLFCHSILGVWHFPDSLEILPQGKQHFWLHIFDCGVPSLCLRCRHNTPHSSDTNTTACPSHSAAWLSIAHCSVIFFSILSHCTVSRFLCRWAYDRGGNEADTFTQTACQFLLWSCTFIFTYLSPKWEGFSLPHGRCARLTLALIWIPWHRLCVHSVPSPQGYILQTNRP